MKKLVLFTLVMVVCLSGAAFAADERQRELWTQHCPRRWHDSVAVSANNSGLLPDARSDATTGVKNADVKTDDVLYQNQSGRGATQLDGPGSRALMPALKTCINKDMPSSEQRLYVVDNAVLANVNVAQEFD